MLSTKSTDQVFSISIFEMCHGSLSWRHAQTCVAANMYLQWLARHAGQAFTAATTSTQLSRKLQPPETYSISKQNSEPFCEFQHPSSTPVLGTWCRRAYPVRKTGAIVNHCRQRRRRGRMLGTWLCWHHEILTRSSRDPLTTPPRNASRWQSRRESWTLHRSWTSQVRKSSHAIASSACASFGFWRSSYPGT